MEYFTAKPFEWGTDFHKSTHNPNALNTLPPKVPGGRAEGGPDRRRNFKNLRLHPKRKHRLRVQRLPRLQQRRLKLRVIRRLRKVLRLQAERRILLIRHTVLPMLRSIQKVP